MFTNLGPHTDTVEQALAEAIRIESRLFNPADKPDLNGLKKCILKPGPRAYKAALYWTIQDRHTQKVKHHQLTLLTLNHTKKDGWRGNGKNTITLSDEQNNEIARLFNFLAIEAKVGAEGDYLVLNLGELDEQRLDKVLKAVIER